MNTNTFVVKQYQQDLAGTILLALRPPNGEDAYQSRVVEVNRAGEVVWEYRLVPGLSDLVVTGEVRKLANGDVLFSVAEKIGGSVRYEISKVLEVNRSGQVVREIYVPASWHAEFLPNGNLLAVDAIGNVVTEVGPSGNIVWRWSPADHILPYNTGTYKGFEKETSIKNIYADSPYARMWVDDWTHVNSAQRLTNGNTVLSLRNLDLVVEVNPKGGVIWTYGPLVLKHQHCAWILDNGHLLVTDNGNGRVIEVDRSTQQIVWEYGEGLNMPNNGCAYRLPSGNTLITDAHNRRIVEVTPDKQVAWELTVKTPTFQLYRAWWSP